MAPPHAELNSDGTIHRLRAYRNLMRGHPMTNINSRSKAVAISAVSLPIAVFTGYLASILVPLILRFVIPAIVQSVTQ
jgi:hypothetical protein